MALPCLLSSSNSLAALSTTEKAAFFSAGATLSLNNLFIQTNEII